MEKECEYCAGLRKRGCAAIGRKKADFGALGEWSLTAETAEFPDGPRLLVGLYGDGCGIDFSEKISYCPFCGKRIRRGGPEGSDGDLPTRPLVRIGATDRAGQD